MFEKCCSKAIPPAVFCSSCMELANHNYSLNTCREIPNIGFQALNLHRVNNCINNSDVSSFDYLFYNNNDCNGSDLITCINFILFLSIEKIPIDRKYRIDIKHRTNTISIADVNSLMDTLLGTSIELLNMLKGTANQNICNNLKRKATIIVYHNNNTQAMQFFSGLKISEFRRKYCLDKIEWQPYTNVRDNGLSCH